MSDAEVESKETFGAGLGYKSFMKLARKSALAGKGEAILSLVAEALIKLTLYKLKELSVKERLLITLSDVLVIVAVTLYIAELSGSMLFCFCTNTAEICKPGLFVPDV